MFISISIPYILVFVFPRNIGVPKDPPLEGLLIRLGPSDLGWSIVLGNTYFYLVAHPT